MKEFILKIVKKSKGYGVIAIAKLIPILKGLVPFLKKLLEELRKIGIFILSLFERHQKLSIRYNQYDSQGEIIDVIGNYNDTNMIPILMHHYHLFGN